MKKMIFVIAIFSLIPPVFGQIGIKGDLHQKWDAAPGDRIRGSIVITNAADEQKAAVITVENFTQAGRKMMLTKNDNSNADWISLSADRVLVPAKSSHEISYTINVPKKKKLAGDYYSLIFVSEDSTFRKRPGMGANLRVKIATIVETMFAGGVPDLEFRLISYVDRKAYVIVENTGNKSYTGQLTFAIGGHTFDGQKSRIFPGGQKCWIFNVDLASGRTNTMAIIDAGDAGQWGTKRMINVGVLKKK